MSNLTDVMNELKDSAATESTQTNTVEAGAAQAPDQTDTSGSDKVTEPEDKVPEQHRKKDLSSVSKQEKAEYAFRRQLAKNRDKYDADLKARDADIAALRKEIADMKAAKEAAKAPEQKYRKDFASDEEYLQWYMDQVISKRFSDRDAAHAKAKEDADAKARAEDEATQARTQASNLFLNNIDSTFVDDAEAKSKFQQTLKIASDNGLGAVLDNSPLVKNYIFRNPDGVRLLNRILTDRDTFMRVFKQSDPTEALLEAHDVVRELRQASTQAQPHKLPSIGKPGAGGNGASSSPNIYNDDKALIDFLRQPRRR